MSEEPVLATEETVDGDEKVKTREAAEQANALDKLTDRVRELGTFGSGGSAGCTVSIRTKRYCSQAGPSANSAGHIDQVEEKELDQAKVQRAMAEIAASEQAEREAQKLRCAYPKLHPTYQSRGVRPMQMRAAVA